MAEPECIDLEDFCGDRFKVEYEPRWTDLAQMARITEDIGLDSVWVGDHYLYREDGRSRGPWEAWTQLAEVQFHYGPMKGQPITRSRTKGRCSRSRPAWIVK